MSKSRGPKAIPSVVQLPGGVRLSAIPFRITSYDEEGRPKTFEIQPAGTEPVDEDDCALFALEEWIRKPNPTKVR